MVKIHIFNMCVIHGSCCSIKVFGPGSPREKTRGFLLFVSRKVGYEFGFIKLVLGSGGVAGRGRWYDLRPVFRVLFNEDVLQIFFIKFPLPL